MFVSHVKFVIFLASHDTRHVIFVCSFCLYLPLMPSSLRSSHISYSMLCASSAIKCNSICHPFVHSRETDASRSIGFLVWYDIKLGNLRFDCLTDQVLDGSVCLYINCFSLSISLFLNGTMMLLIPLRLRKFVRKNRSFILFFKKTFMFTK